MPTDRNHGKFAYLYHKNRWRKLSERHRIHEPLCRNCSRFGRVTVGAVCDHVNGHPEDETLEQFWAGPFQTLCLACHSGDKRQLERSGIERGCDADGWLLPPSNGAPAPDPAAVGSPRSRPFRRRLQR